MEYCGAVKRSRSFKLQMSARWRVCSKASGKESIDLYSLCAHRSTSFVNQIEREKRILIAQSFFSWMNIDSHSNPPKKKFPVNRLTMKFHFFLSAFSDPQHRKKADRHAMDSLSLARVRWKEVESEKWFHTECEWIVNWWWSLNFECCPPNGEEEAIRNRRRVRLMRKSSRDDFFGDFSKRNRLSFTFFHLRDFLQSDSTVVSGDCCKLPVKRK